MDDWADGDSQVEQTMVDRARTLAPMLREASSDIEEARSLPDHVAASLADADLFQMYRPAFLDGPDVAPLDALEACEELGRHDGSAAWCVQVSNAVAPLLGAIDPAAAEEMCRRAGDLRLSGSARPLGEAREVEGGYQLSGRWNFASNVNHANWFMASAFVVDDNNDHGEGARSDPSRPRRTVSAYLPVGDGTIVPNWDVVGMRGTGSDDFVLDNVFVPTEFTAARRHLEARTERRFHPRATMTVTWSPVTGVSLGLARGAIDQLVELGERTSSGSSSALRTRREVHAAIGEADVVLCAARALATEAIGTVWRQAGDGPDGVSDIAVARSLMAISHAIRESARAVDLVFHAAGTNAISTEHGLERRFRDAHAALQHVSASRNQIEVGGKVILGLAAEHPYF